MTEVQNEPDWPGEMLVEAAGGPGDAWSESAHLGLGLASFCNNLLLKMQETEELLPFAEKVGMHTHCYRYPHATV